MTARERGLKRRSRSAPSSVHSFLFKVFPFSCGGIPGTIPVLQHPFQGDLIFPLEDRVRSTLLLCEIAASRLFEERLMRRDFWLVGPLLGGRTPCEFRSHYTQLRICFALETWFLYGREFQEFRRIQHRVNGSQLARISILIYRPAYQPGSRYS